MAQFISKPLNGVDPDSEIKVARALEQLGDEWKILHSVAWQGIRGARQGDGEADFVLASKKVGLIVLEVKGGGVFVRNGRWSSEDRHGDLHDIKDPFEQAVASKAKLHRWLSDTLELNVPTMHAVVFPDITASANLGPAGSPEIVIDRGGLTSLVTAIQRVAKHWKLPCNLDDGDLDRIVGALAPTVTVRRTRADDAYDAEHALIRLTDEQRRAFAGLRRARRAIILGGPGTGKTLLAREKAAQLSEDGSSVLLVCYNTLLAKELGSENLPGVKVSTYHSLCMSAMKSAGLQIPSPISEYWWEQEAPISLVEAGERSSLKFDAIIVDEGQDFSNDWLQSLKALLSDYDASPLYVFADADQRIWPRNWTPDPDWFPYELTINCRNTEPISSRVCAVAGKRNECLGVSGPPPKWSSLARGANVPRFICNTVVSLLDEGFEPEDIAVLCEDPALAKEVSQMSVGGHVFCSHGGRGIVVETVARFKGLEASAVVLVLNGDGNLPDTAAYVGFSRARTYLHVIGSPARHKSTNWDAKLS